MKKIYPWIFVSSVMFLSTSCFIFQPQKMTAENKVALSKVYAKVLDQFMQARDEIKGIDGARNTVTLTEADVVFDNVITDELDASLSILIFKAGYTHIKKKETTVTYSLTAPPANPAPRVANNGKNPNAIKDLIVGAYKQFVAISVPQAVGTFQKSVEIDIAFTVEQSGDIDVSDAIGSFTPEVTLTRDVANTQTMKVTFTINQRQ